MQKETLTIDLGTVQLTGDLVLPENPQGLVIFAHGSGSSRLSSRNQQVARALEAHNLGTFLFDLLSPQEDLDRENRFDIPLITQRLADVTEWLRKQPHTQYYSLGYFGASTGAAAALGAAAKLDHIRAVVSRGGRPDLALPDLPKVKAATLLLVGSLDGPVVGMNEEAFAQLHVPKELVIIEGATHLFEEPGKLEEVAERAAQWFRRWL